MTDNYVTRIHRELDGLKMTALYLQSLAASLRHIGLTSADEVEGHAEFINVAVQRIDKIIGAKVQEDAQASFDELGRTAMAIVSVLKEKGHEIGIDEGKDASTNN